MSGWSGHRVRVARANIRSRGRMQSCWRCGRTMDLDRERWHVGHVIDRALGGDADDPANQAPEHPLCNTRAGGKLGGARSAARRRAVVERTERTRRW